MSTEITPYNSSTNPLITLAQYNSLLDHGLEKPYSYLIRKNGSYYEAIKGGTNTGAGTIAFGGASTAGGAPGTSLNAVFTACQTANAHIRFAPGNYTVLKGDLVGGQSYYCGLTVDTLSGVWVEGSGPATIFTQNERMMRTFSAIDAPYCRFSNFTIDGDNIENQHSPNAADGLLVVDQNSDYAEVDHIRAFDGLNVDGMGCFAADYVNFHNNIVSGTEHGIVLTECIGSKIQNNIVFDVDSCGALIHGHDYCVGNEISSNHISAAAINGAQISSVDPASYVGPDYCKIVNNTITNCQRGIAFAGNGHKIINNSVKASALDNIYLFSEFSPTGFCLNNDVSHNQAVSSIAGWGIIEHDNHVGYNNIFDNEVLFNNLGGISPFSATTNIQGNQGFVSENGGTAIITAAATEVTVTHGLSFTPLWDDITVNLLGDTTADIGSYWFDTLGATQFKIKCHAAPGVSTAVFNWRAKRPHTY